MNLADRIIERHSEPVAGTYARRAPYRPGESVALLAFPDVAVQVDELIGA